MNLILLLLIILILVIFVTYIRNLTKINDSLEILQLNQESTFDTIQKTLSYKLPTVFKGVLYDCDPICDIFDLTLESIWELSNPKYPYFKKLLTAFLSPYSLPFSNNWEYSFNETYRRDNNNHSNYPQATHKPQYYTFIKEDHHRHFICQITGKQRIYLANPTQGKNIKARQEKTHYHNTRFNNSFNFFNKNDREKDPYKNIKYIEIILREGNMIYIPKGWYYIQDYEKDNQLMSSESDNPKSTLTSLEKKINEKNLTMDLYLNTWFDLI